jgi:Ca2+-binding RTX toxin-like protein
LLPAQALISAASPLFKYIPMTVVSVDSDGDHILDPLFKFAPTTSSVGTIELAAGFAINAQVNLGGEKGTLLFNSDAEFKKMSGSLVIENIKLGSVLTISGTQPGTDLTASFSIDTISNDARFNGDGKIALFGMTLTKGRFEVVHTSEIDSVSITNAEINLGLGALKIDQFSLKLDGTQSHALGNGSLDILGQQAVTASFDISKDHVAFTANVKLVELLHINGSFDWNSSTNEINASGALNINGTTIANAKFHSDAAGNATITGNMNVPVGGNFGTVSTKVTVHYKSSGAISIDIDANLGALGHVKPSLKIEEFNVNKLGTVILHDANELVGNISEVAQKAIDAGITTISSFATHTFTKGNFNSISDALDNLGGEIGDFFSGGGKRPANSFASDADNTPTSGDPLKSSGQNDILYGNGGNDIVYGGSGKDYIDGGTGNDYLNGQTGNDTIYGGTGNDKILGETGDDRLYGGAGDDLIEDFSGNNNLYGDAGNDTLNGAGNLFGGAGDDRLVSGAGSDVLVGNSGNDLAFGGGGNDFLEGDEGDDALHGEAGNDTIYGGSGNDGMTGGDGNDSLYGQEGNDTLVGGEGADYMEGDQGDDTYYVQSPFDVVTENANEGTDTVFCSGNYQLGANVENLTLTGTANDVGFGNELNNLIIGSAANNVLEGRAGNDTLDGGTGADTLDGGSGNDTYIVDNKLDVIQEEGNSKTEIDSVFSSVSYVLGRNLENLTLTGDAIKATGNDSDNILTGNAQVNTLTGGEGDDTYIVQNTGDVVVETSGLNSGSDTVLSSVDYTLPANVEKLTLTGANAISGTGNSKDNKITGNAGANSINGGGGADKLLGGDGNDTYFVDNAGDIVTENANEGTDTVLSSVTFSLSANVENLTLTGTAAIDATGNALNNVLTGNAAINTLTGGAGDDTYIVQNAEDKVVENAKEGIDTVLNSVTYTLGANVENLTLTGTAAINGTGNELNNTLTGNVASNYLTGGAGSDVLDGGAGADTLEGNAGNDWYIVDNIGDKVIEVKGDGIDTVFSSVNYSLSDEVENLTLNGVSYAAKTVYSITNNDYRAIKTLIAMKLSTSAWDKATVNAIKGGAKYADFGTTTPAHFEGALAGGGNALKNTLTGNDGDNNLNGGAGADTLIGGAGNDYLDGGTGADSLDGGAGSDVYVVDNVNDVIIESGTGLSDFDTVRSSITYTLIANVERLELTGTAALDGTGNAGNNFIKGNANNNTLNGGDGNDSLIGREGNDTLLGGTGDDMLDGGDGNDRLNGGAGADVLFAGAGKDTFVTTLSPIFGLSDVDTYADFTVADDKIELGTVGYNGLPYTHAATFAAGEFIAGAGFTAAKDADDRIIYDTTTGALYFDRDGNGVNVAIKFAVVLVGTALTADSFTFA